MNSSVRLMVSVDDEVSGSCHTMARRSRLCTIVTSIDECELLLTDSFDRAQRAAHSQRPVLLLNPWRLSRSERQVLAETQLVSPALPKRFSPSIAEVHCALQDDRLGAPGLLRIHRWERPNASTDEMLVTEVDLANWLFGSGPETVYGIQRTDYTQIHLGYPNGGMALIDIRSASISNRYYSLCLIGADGAAYADDHRNMQLLLCEEGMQAVGSPPNSLELLNLIEAFLIYREQSSQQLGSWNDCELALRITEYTLKAAGASRVLSASDLYADRAGGLES